VPRALKLVEALIPFVAISLLSPTTLFLIFGRGVVGASSGIRGETPRLSPIYTNVSNDLSLFATRSSSKSIASCHSFKRALTDGLYVILIITKNRDSSIWMVSYLLTK
jgi:hypothetical protein